MADHGDKAVNLVLERGKPVPLARQIQAQVERLIHERRLGPGAKLPATRELARELGVNRATVAEAYGELVAAGLARAHVGQGTFVADTAPSRPDPAAAPERPSVDWSGLLSRSAQLMVEDEARRQLANAAEVMRHGLSEKTRANR